ncbi:MAG: hypothetical protein H0W70_15435 [Actinobacteria bacterium]|nr:hypothetical protein [Actinomycetota bacterium]
MLAAVIALLGTACNPTSSVASCQPEHVDNGPDGYVTMQQGSAGTYVQWGMQPKDSQFATYGHWVVDVYTDLELYDHKDQTYVPHGSIENYSGRGVKPGKLLEIKGTVTALGAAAKIYGVCKMA